MSIFWVWKSTNGTTPLRRCWTKGPHLVFTGVLFFNHGTRNKENIPSHPFLETARGEDRGMSFLASNFTCCLLFTASLTRYFFLLHISSTILRSRQCGGVGAVLIPTKPCMLRSSDLGVLHQRPYLLPRCSLPHSSHPPSLTSSSLCCPRSLVSMLILQRLLSL